MITNPLGFAGNSHQTARTRHGWSIALQLAPDLYPGVGGKRFRAALLQRTHAFAGGASLYLRTPHCHAVTPSRPKPTAAYLSRISYTHTL
jgi:hypothetical protein